MTAIEAPPLHPAIAGFHIGDDRLYVGGVALDRLAARVGSTPFFAYDRGLITERVAALRSALPAEVHLHYAIKANPMPAVVQHLSRLVDGFDVASVREMQTALDTGMAADCISFAGPGKTPPELVSAVAAGIVLHLESEGEMEAVAMASRDLGIRPRVAIRVNPDFELKSSGMKMGGGAKQFGVDAERVPDMMRRIANLGFEFLGFHIFSGSQNLKAEAIEEAQANTADLAIRLSASAPAPIQHLNIGGGFGIPYFPGDRPLDLGRVGRSLRDQLRRLRQALPGARVIVELGRYLVGEAGVYVCRVVDRKVSRGHVFLITDGGLHHQLAASGNFGQVLRRNYPIAVGTRMSGSPRETVTVVGCLCTPLDLLGDKVELPRAEVGDLVVVFQSGAYGLSASPAAFLSHPPAAEVLV
jgi:diaminopimelate decarboxylase